MMSTNISGLKVMPAKWKLRSKPRIWRGYWCRDPQPGLSADRLRSGPEIGIEAPSARHPVLPRARMKLLDHAHLQVFDRGDVAVPEMSPSIGRQIVTGTMEK